MNIYYPYEYSEEKLERLSFPIIQHFHYDLNDLRVINFFLKDESINNYDYQIDIIGKQTGNNYFSHNYHEYDSNTIIMELNRIPAKKDKDFIMTIECEKCNDVQLSIKKSNDKKNYIEGEKNNDVLEFNLVNYIKNDSYFWYPIVGIVIAFMFYPLAREEDKYDKKKNN